MRNGLLLWNSIQFIMNIDSENVSENDPSDLDSALDIIFQHQNVAPHVSRHLITRLVTSNPSSSYIQRVSAKFDNDGSGVKGNMKAVVRAVLLDKEASYKIKCR